MTAGKAEIAGKAAAAPGVDRRTAMGFVSAVLDAQTQALAEHGDLTIRGFGTFRVMEIAQSRARNPATGEAVVVPPHKRVRFKAGKALRDTVAGRR